MTEQTANPGSTGLIDRLMEWVPVWLRRGAAIVPVVRLCGLGGAGEHFARRLSGAVAPDLLADQAARGGKETAGAGVRRGCRGLRRLHARLRRRRDLLRSVVDPGLDRRGRRLLRILGGDQEGRRRAAALYGGGGQEGARSVPAGEPPRG